MLTCTGCRIYVGSLLNDFRNGVPLQQLADSAFGMCRLVSDYSDEFCRGVVDLNTDPLFFIAGARPNLTPNHLYSLVLPGQCGVLDPNVFSFTVSISQGQQMIGPKTVTRVYPTTNLSPD